MSKIIWHTFTVLVAIEVADDVDDVSFEEAYNIKHHIKWEPCDGSGLNGTLFDFDVEFGGWEFAEEYEDE